MRQSPGSILPFSLELDYLTHTRARSICFNDKICLHRCGCITATYFFNINEQLAFNTSDIHYPLPVVKIACHRPRTVVMGSGRNCSLTRRNWLGADSKSRPSSASAREVILSSSHTNLGSVAGPSPRRSNLADPQADHISGKGLDVFQKCDSSGQHFSFRQRVLLEDVYIVAQLHEHDAVHKTSIRAADLLLN